MTAVEEVLGALADPTRRDLLERLSVHGYATASTLAGELPISRQAVVQHLAVLDAVGLVHGQRFGRENRFVVRPERLSEAARWMNVLAARWDQRLATIRQLAEAAEAGNSSSAAMARAETSVSGQH
jgi:DNA-binding transcriptional ArsR family regulator